MEQGACLDVPTQIGFYHSHQSLIRECGRSQSTPSDLDTSWGSSGCLALNGDSLVGDEHLRSPDLGSIRGGRRGKSLCPGPLLFNLPSLQPQLWASACALDYILQSEPDVMIWGRFSVLPRVRPSSLVGPLTTHYFFSQELKHGPYPWL